MKEQEKTDGSNMVMVVSMPRINTTELAVTDHLLWAYYAPNPIFFSLSLSPLNLTAELGENYIGDERSDFWGLNQSYQRDFSRSAHQVLGERQSEV